MHRKSTMNLKNNWGQNKIIFYREQLPIIIVYLQPGRVAGGTILTFLSARLSAPIVELASVERRVGRAIAKPTKKARQSAKHLSKNNSNITFK